MPLVHLAPEAWPGPLDRLSAYRKSVALAWAVVHRSGQPDAVLAITVRGDVDRPRVRYDYDRLSIGTESLSGPEMAERLRSQCLTGGTEALTFDPPRDQGGSAYWSTSGLTYGMAAVPSCPYFYYASSIAPQEVVQEAALSSPLYASGQPYFPEAQDALLEILYGLTQDQGRRDIHNQLVVQLPYDDAYLEALQYVPGEGTVVRVGEGSAGSSIGHELHLLSKLHLSDRHVTRIQRILTGETTLAFPMPAEPARLSAALVGTDGKLVDSLDAPGRYPQSDTGLPPLPPGALLEAFDYLGSVWQNVFHQRLFLVRHLAEVGELLSPVTDRDSFKSRMSDLADVMKSMHIPDDLVDSATASGTAKDSSVARLRSALRKLGRQIESPDLDAALAALDILKGVNDVRRALQHSGSDLRLDETLARLAIDYPPDWTQAWERVQRLVLQATTDVRRGLEGVVE